MGGVDLGRAHAEVGLGRGLDAVGAVTEVHGVEVALEHRPLAELVHDPLREHHLVELAPEVVPGREQGRLHELLGDRRASLPDSPCGHVGAQRPKHGPGVDAAVVPVVRVLRVEHRVHQRRGDPRQRHRLAVLDRVQDGDHRSVGGIDDRPPGERWQPHVGAEAG